MIGYPTYELRCVMIAPVTKTIHNLRFDQPPVRSVVLTVYFKALEDFTLVHAMRLTSDWADKYPDVRQESLRPRPQEVASSNPFSGEWPLPRVVLTHQSLSHALSFQSDQISLRWTFDEKGESGNYPGFERLLRELEQAFSHFSQVIDSDSSSNVQIQACTCEYVNIVDEIGFEQWVLGYVTDWTPAAKSTAAYLAPRARPQRYTYTAVSDEGGDGTQPVLTCGVNVVGRKHGGVSMRLRGTAELPKVPAKDNSNSGDVVELLVAAHDNLTLHFAQLSSSEMKESWGVQHVR